MLFLMILCSSPRKERLRIVSAMLSADPTEASALALEREGVPPRTGGRLLPDPSVPEYSD